MSERIAELPRISLVKNSLLSIEIQARYDFAESVVNGLLKLSSQKQNGDIVFGGLATYSIAKTSYFIRATVQTLETAEKLSVSIKYAFWGGSSRRRSLQDREREAGLIHALAELGIPLSCRYSFQFEYHLDSVELWFPLPTQITGSGDNIYQIEGVAVSKLSIESPNESQYRFFLSTTAENAHANLFFGSDNVIQPDTILVELGRAKTNVSEVISVTNRS